MWPFGRSDLNRAISIYLGVGLNPYPQPDFARVVARLGKKRAEAVHAKLEAIFEALDAESPNWSRHSLIAATNHAVAGVKRRFRDLDRKSLRALRWSYSWGYR